MITAALFLLHAFAAPAFTSGQSIETITLDPNSYRSISPYIYGVNFPDWSTMNFGITVARQGGNRLTAYNWETNASNAGNDYHNQNDGYMGETNEPGWSVRTFLQPTQAHGAAAILTVPTEGYVAADKSPGGDVNLTPNYLNVRFNKSYANKPGGNYAYPPDTTDHAVYQDEFVHWVESIKSNSTPVWFSLDNEPDLWASTHSRICLSPITYAQLIANNIQFATAIKGQAPNSLVFGPANYGWEGFRTLQNASDANGRIFVDAYLDAMKQAEQSVGHRILDSYDFHWYPEAQSSGGVRITTSDGGPDVAAARIQAPRSLWDPTYVEKSWITQSLGNQPIALLPDMFNRIASHYPGTKLSITEYNYGGDNVISGAIAQADVLGIFGRYGLFAACNWGVNATMKAQIAGFLSYLNYDRKGSRFLSNEIAVSGTSPAINSVYASTDSPKGQHMTIVAINKTDFPMPMRFTTGHLRYKSAVGYGITSANFDTPSAVSCSIRSNNVLTTLPPMSVVTIALAR